MVSVADPAGLPVPRANVVFIHQDPATQTLSVQTQDNGDVKLSWMRSGRWTAQITAPGFATAEFELNISTGEPLRTTFTLMPLDVEEMVVVGRRGTWRDVRRGEVKANEGTVTGAYTLTRRDIEATPGSLEDVVRAVHALPGVVSDGDMVAEFTVHGGDARDVVFLLDRVPLENPYHLAGFNSLFNPDMIRDVQFYAGAAPADVPAATSAVVSVNSWDGAPRQDARDIDGAVDISAHAARLFVMGPIDRREKATFAFAARRTYLEAYLQILKWAQVVDTAFSAPEFSEISGRLAYRPHPDHRLLFTNLFAADSLKLVDSEDESLIEIDGVFELRNALFLSSIDHLWTPSDPFQWQTTVAYTFNQSFMNRDLGGVQSNKFVTHRGFARTDLTWTLDRHEIKLGADVSLFKDQARGEIEDPRGFPDWAFSALGNFGIEQIELGDRPHYADASAYLQHIWRGPVQVRVGTRGRYAGATKEWLFSPTAGLSVPLPTGTIPKLAFGVYHRTPRDPVAFSTTFGSPSTVQSERAIHATLGVDQALPLGVAGTGLARIEAYVISLDNLLVHPDNVADLAHTTFTNDGAGLNYGMDVLLAARVGRINTSLQYSLLFAHRTNPLNTRFASDYAPAQDQRHTLGHSVEVQVHREWRTTARYSFHSGRPVSAVVANGPDSVDLACLNCQRLGPFHSLDLRVEWRRAFKFFRLSAYFEILNVFNYQSDFFPTATVTPKEDNPNAVGDLEQGVFKHLPIRPFFGIRADF